MFENISKAKEFFIKFGGHPMAAGFSLEEKNLDSLRDFLIKNSPLTFDDISEILNIDLIYPINYVNEAFIKKLEELKPFGKGNHKPLFRDNGINLQRLSIIGKNKNVLKFNFLSEKKEVEGIIDALAIPTCIYSSAMLVFSAIIIIRILQAARITLREKSY